MAQEKLSDIVDGLFYAPHDFPWAVRSTLRALKPRLVIVMETEIWPNLFRESRRFGAGLIIANGRISDRSAPRYAARASLFGPGLKCCDWILAQSKQDAERFISAGADPRAVSVAGNLKYDFTPPSSGPPREVSEFLERVDAWPVIVAGSTREEEEEPIAKAFAELGKDRPRATLIVAPRHPGRFDEAADALERSGLPFVRRSELSDDAQLDLPGALLLDSLGELASVYAFADIVFVGGSLNGWGGHNVLEPALSDKPVVTGPDTQNFRAIVERLRADGGLVEIASADEFAAVCRRLLDDPAQAEAIAERGRAAAEAERGAAERIAQAAAVSWREAAPTNPASSLKRVILTPASWLWKRGDRINRTRAKPNRLPRPVVSIGNLSVGGAGKTPTALWMLRQLALRGRRPALLTRGYRRRSVDKIIIAGPNDPLGPGSLGDEPAEIFRRLRSDGLAIPIGVGADRHAVGLKLLERFADVDVFVLDDGFQHYRLERDFDLVLVDVIQPPDLDALLPLGRLRESPAALNRADALLLMRAEADLEYESLRRRLDSSDKPFYRGRRSPIEAVDGATEETFALQAIQDVSAFVFCAIGNPANFLESLETLGVRIVGSETFRDHHRYTHEDWWRIAKLARESKAEILLTTDKDLSSLDANVPAPTRTGGPPLRTLRIELHVDRGDELLRQIEEAID